MALVLVAIVAVAFAAIFLPPIFNPVHEQFVASSSVTSPYGFTLNLGLNTTAVPSGGAVSISAWLNSTSPQIESVSAISSWPIGPAGLWTKTCTAGWPLGVGVLEGYFDSSNYTEGALVQIPGPLINCPNEAPVPTSFILQPFNSNALVESGGSAKMESLQSALTYAPRSPILQQHGAFTVVAIDEWGDVAVVHFTSDS